MSIQRTLLFQAAGTPYEDADEANALEVLDYLKDLVLQNPNPDERAGATISGLLGVQLHFPRHRSALEDEQARSTTMKTQLQAWAAVSHIPTASEMLALIAAADAAAGDH